MTEEQKYIDFEAHVYVALPHKRDRVTAWHTAIGLQDVDGLLVCAYPIKPKPQRIDDGQ